MKWLLFWVHKVVTTETHQSKNLMFSKRKLAVTNKQLQKSRQLYLMHFTSLLWLLKEFWGRNLQIVIPSASAYAFGQRPNFLKRELRLRPNVKNTASVILCEHTLRLRQPRLAWVDFKIKVKQIEHSTLRFHQWNPLISKI